MKKPTHKKGKFESVEIIKGKAEISTIRKARDLIRAIAWNEFRSPQELSYIKEHLTVCLDRLVRMGLNSVPSPSDLVALVKWSDTTALSDIEQATNYIKARKEDLISQEKQHRKFLFLDPKKRRLWLDSVFGNNSAGCPDFAIDSITGIKTSNPDEVKRIYLQDGATFLKSKMECPPPFSEKMQQTSGPFPNLKEPRKLEPRDGPRCLPRWWNTMYHRDAKGISEKVWANLMIPTTWQEVVATIRQSDPGKAAGYDGVSSDLLLMLTENVDTQPTALLNILTALINVIFAHGQSLSWRKAIISMIPKKNEDGSSSKFISDMRPISVLQEFGKLASKILANRIGLILLDNPNIMSAAQRAFLKDGSTSQCLHTAINILEDVKESHKSDSKKQLFILAYDQSKAFDSVQSYTIKASLERFNLPASFIEYALSNLESE
jgi:hypothetical protein